LGNADNLEGFLARSCRGGSEVIVVDKWRCQGEGPAADGNGIEGNRIFIEARAVQAGIT
jgi:hypothetical protein